MWQRLVALPAGVIAPAARRAYTILRENGRNFGSVERMFATMERDRALLFYFHGTGFELVFGFRPSIDSKDGLQQLATLGWSGPEERTSFQNALQAMTAMLREAHATGLVVSLLKLPAGDPEREMYDEIMELVRALPGVELSSRDEGNRTRYVARLAS